MIDQLQNGLESVDASNRRFRAEVQVTDDQIHARYDEFAKQLRDKGAAAVPSRAGQSRPDSTVADLIRACPKHWKNGCR